MHERFSDHTSLHVDWDNLVFEDDICLVIDDILWDLLFTIIQLSPSRYLTSRSMDQLVQAH